VEASLNVNFSNGEKPPSFCNDHSLKQLCDFSGTLGPKQKKEVKISFKTDSAKVVISTIVIKLAEGGKESTYILKVSAIGKYPFITLDSTSLDFENLLVGKTVSKEINVQNSSSVPTHYEITKVSDDGKDQSFSLSTSKGVLNPGQISTITMKYTPSIAGTVSCAYYKISAAGGNELEFSGKGQADGYDVELSAQSVHFGEV